jgi:hypothetical protein
MNALRRLMIAFLAVAMLASGAARAASTPNFSDQWWIEAESGWGASVLQQADIIFVDLFVYGADNAPTWFTAAAAYQSTGPAGHVVFVGDLYRTNGPYYGAPFGSAPVTYAKVGTLMFDADTVTTATLTYTVGGVAYVKNVTRQTWRFENLSGSYYGGLINDETCVPASDSGHFEDPATIRITHNSDNSVQINIQTPEGDDLTFNGNYTQSGHMGRIDATFASATFNVSLTVFEIERTISGFTARFIGNTSSGTGSCVITNGRIGGVRR